MMRELDTRKIQSRLLFAVNITRQPVFTEMRNSTKGYRIIDDLQNTDKLMNDALGGVLLSHFLKVKNKEWENYRTQLTQWEIEKYLPIL